MRKLIHAIKKRLRDATGRIPEQSRLPYALGVAIVFVFIMTIVSVSIYSLSGTVKLDLSRPGFEREREEVKTSDSQKTYDTTSPITSGAIDDFLHEYDARAKDITEYGNFHDQVLDDNDLQLTNQSADN